MTPSCEMEMLRELVKRVGEDRSHPITVPPDAIDDEFGELLRRLKQSERDRPKISLRAWEARWRA